MKVVSFTPCHYGKDYLGYALRSVSPVVEECWVLYSPVPSYGHATSLPCPDTREELREAASWGAGSKLRWHDPETPYAHEGQHRDHIFELTDASLIVCVDADEIWHEDSLRKSIPEVLESPGRQNRVGMQHLFKSFNWVCNDQAMPVRLIIPGNPPNTEGYVQLDQKMLHFGYARTASDVAYKWSCHGHYGEMRNDYDWLEMFRNWRPQSSRDVHPTCTGGYWVPEPFDKANIPAFMASHPYFDLEFID